MLKIGPIFLQRGADTVRVNGGMDTGAWRQDNAHPCFVPRATSGAMRKGLEGGEKPEEQIHLIKLCCIGRGSS